MKTISAIRGGEYRFASTPFNCEVCHHQINEYGVHNLINGVYVVCHDCMASHAAHQLAHPGCTEDWHDGWDGICSSSSGDGPRFKTALCFDRATPTQLIHQNAKELLKEAQSC